MTTKKGAIIIFVNCSRNDCLNCVVSGGDIIICFVGCCDFITKVTATITLFFHPFSSSSAVEALPGRSNTVLLCVASSLLPYRPKHGDRDHIPNGSSRTQFLPHFCSYWSCQPKCNYKMHCRPLLCPIAGLHISVCACGNPKSFRLIVVGSNLLWCRPRHNPLWPDQSYTNSRTSSPVNLWLHRAISIESQWPKS